MFLNSVCICVNVKNDSLMLPDVLFVSLCLIFVFSEFSIIYITKSYNIFSSMLLQM